MFINNESVNLLIITQTIISVILEEMDEYLNTLLGHKKWTKLEDNLKRNDLVLIEYSVQLRLEWQTG